MVDNYIETGRTVLPEDAEEYAVGIGLINDFVIF